MRRMLRILKCLALTLSTLLFLVTIILWVRSLGHEEGWNHDCFEPNPAWNAGPLSGLGTYSWRYVEAVHGRLWIASGTLRAQADLGVQEGPPMARRNTFYARRKITRRDAAEKFRNAFEAARPATDDRTDFHAHFAGLGFARYRDPIDPEIGGPPRKGFDLAIPFWLPAILFGLSPALFTARRIFRRKRFAAGLCPACGYDLRATPDPSGPRLARCPECGRHILRQQD